MRAMTTVSQETEESEMTFSRETMTFSLGDRIAARPRRRSARLSHLALGLLAALLVAAALATPAHAAFGIESFTGEVLDAQGNPATQAGAHPDTASTTIKFNTTSANGGLVPDGSFKTIEVGLPAGFVANPTATMRCPVRTYLDTLGLGCPRASQVGTATITMPGSPFSGLAVYNLVPPPDKPALFAFAFLSNRIFLSGVVRSEENYRLGVSVPDNTSAAPVFETSLTFWGVPADHNGSDAPRKPFISNPSDCSAGLLTTNLSVDSWQEPESFVSAAFDHEPDGAPFEVTGCEKVDFQPTMTLNPAGTQAGEPTGYSVDLRLPQNENPDGIATGDLKKTVVQLPAGVTVSPSAASGLGACSPAQIGLDNRATPTCPESSKIGTLQIKTPLLEDPLGGSIYLAEQGNNPFGTLLAIYLVAEADGVVIKIPGRVDPDPQTGQLTATFENTPQLPFEDFSLNFFGGSRAALVTPSRCGTYTTDYSMTAWSGQQVNGQSPFKIEQGCDGGGFDPGFEAGTVNPAAGTYSPFNLRVTRKDGEQNLSAIQTTLPAGLTAKLAGVPLCGDAEAVTGNCPAASQIGSVSVGAGAGSSPLYVPQSGKAPTGVYLAGPYKGAPYSLVVKVPAQAGPFDLGTVAVRSKIEVDPQTAQVSVQSDPLPQILEGVPISYRDVRVSVDRPEFVLNPTNCSKTSVGGRVTSSSGTTASVSSRFQAGNCANLGFKPNLKIQLNGATGRIGHPALKAVVTARPGEANIGRAQVNLPHSEFLDQGNLNKTCTKPVLLAGQCPASSVYGHAKAWTPLLDRPLEGNVYLVGGYGYKLPALVADLNGQIRILLVGKVDSGPNKGIRNTFEMVPDAPVSRFELQMKGGPKYGLLENSENLCAIATANLRANARFTGQNGGVDQFKPLVAVQCGKGAKKGK